MNEPSRSDSVVQVTAPARLHMGFLDPSGRLDRRFGGIGLALDRLATTLTVAHAPRFSAQGPQAERAQQYAQEMAERMDLSGGATIRVEESIPVHVGLGSGTQLALAVGTALARLHELDLSCRDIAALLQRGARSGVGIGAFEHGGLLIDGGHGARAGLPPLVARAAFPEQWRVLLVLDRDRRGFAGDCERRAFETLPPFDAAEAGDLCRLVLMHILPAIAEADIDSFGAALTELQARVGDYFAPIQGGRYTSEAVSEALSSCQSGRLLGVGQSSWGPTGFGFCASEAEAQAVRDELAARYRATPRLDFLVCRGRNAPGEVRLQRRNIGRVV